MEHFLKAEEFDKVVCNYVLHGSRKKGIELFAERAEVAFAFATITERILSLTYFQKKNIDFVTKDQLVEEMVAICFDKLSRLDIGKGRAFNFFTIVILSHMRQMVSAMKTFKERLDG